MHRDLMFAARALRRRPTLSAVAVLTLAVGIAVVTTMFALLDGLVWRPLPYPGVERLVGLEEVRDVRSLRPRMQAVTFQAVQEHAQSFTAVVAAEETEATLVVDEVASRERVTRATADAFPLLRVPPLLGRYPAAPSPRTGGGAEVAIGEALWERRFGRDSAIVGRHLVIDGTPATIVGVMPRRFEFYRSSDAWLVLDPGALRREPTQSVFVVAQLRDGVSIEQARAEMDALAAARAGEHQGDSPRYLFRVYHDIVRRDAIQPQLANLLLGTAAAVFLVACINAASLLLARALDRRGELAIRAALGAGRRALFRHNVAEMLVLVGLGGLLSVGLTAAASRALWALTSATLPAWTAMRLDWRVLGVALAAAVIAVVIVALPALRIGRRGNLPQVVASAGAAGGGSRRLPPAAGRLIVGQVAFAFLLVTAAALMYRSYLGLLEIESGLDAEQVLVANVVTGNRNDLHADMREGATYTAAALERLRALPGVETAASSAWFSTWWDEIAALDAATSGSRPAAPAHAGRPQTPTEIAAESLFTDDGRVPKAIYIRIKDRSVSHDYFSTVGLRLRSGRLFGPSDAPQSPRAVIVSRTLAERLWPASAAVGRRIRFGAQGQWITVVGIVEDVQWTYQGWDGTGAGPELRLYFSAEQTASWTGRELLVRTPETPTALAPSVRATLRDIAGTQVVGSIRPLSDDYSETANDRRWMTIILATCGIMTLVLAAVGLYGLLALLVQLRLREVGIRLALGAPAATIAWWVVEHSLRFVGIGVGVGVLLALLSHRVLAIFLFRVSLVDPISYAGAAIVFLGVAVLASLWPVLRALKSDPVAVLREY